MAIGDRIQGRGFGTDDEADRVVGISVDATYAYILNQEFPSKVYVHRLSDGVRQASMEFNLHADNDRAQGISVNNTYAYVVNYRGTSSDLLKTFVYRLSDGVRQTSMEFDLHADNTDSRGISVDANYAYVVDQVDDKVYVYRLSDGARQTGREFDLHLSNNDPEGIGVNATYAYVLHRGSTQSNSELEDHVFVYRLLDGMRQPTLEFDLYFGNANFHGISVDPAYAYVVNVSINYVFVYSILPSESAPGPPATPILTPLVGEIQVSWFAPASVGTSTIVSYDVRHKLSLENTYTTINPAWSSGDGAFTYTITGLDGGTMYDVQVRAVNDVDEGEWSPPAMATALTQSVPGKPDPPTVTTGTGSLGVTWAAPDDDGGSDITAYDLQYRIAGAGWTIIQDAWTAGALAATISNLNPGHEYEVQVRAVNVIGDGDWSFSGATGAVNATVPGAPAIISITPSSRQITVVWTPPALTGGASIASYDVRHRIGNGAYTTINPATAGSLTYTIPNLPGGTTYTVQVRAVNSAGDGPWSTADMGTTPTTAPGAPVGSPLTSTATSVTATWDAPVNPGGATISSYDIRYRRGSNSWIILQDIWNSGARSYTITGLSPNVTYDVQVRAVNSVGPGEWSRFTSTTTGSTIPGQSEIVALAPGDMGLVVQWQAPSSDGGDVIINYDVRWRLV